MQVVEWRSMMLQSFLQKQLLLLLPQPRWLLLLRLLLQLLPVC